MFDNFIETIADTSTTSEYEFAVRTLITKMTALGYQAEAQELQKVAFLRKNRFSEREEMIELSEKKVAIQSFFDLFRGDNSQNDSDIILAVLANFPRFCKMLYRSSIHRKCSSGVKTHLTGFEIENEYDLQKLMLAAISLFFPDAREEVVQDTGHHPVRKDIVIDSISSAIELKCTRHGMTERELSEEVGADITHYNESTLYFYIYDKAGIIKNEDRFKKTYENKSTDGKAIHVNIYAHNDI